MNQSLTRNVLTLAVAALSYMSPLQASEFHVSAGDVYGPAGLIARIRQANTTAEPDTIVLESGTYALTSVDNVLHETDSLVCSGPNGLPQITSPI